MRSQFLKQNRLIIILAAFACLLVVTAASAQTVSVVSGNGQVICPGCFGANNVQFQLTIVKVTDANGNPLPNQTVTWTTTGATLGNTSSITDANGMTSTTLFPSNFINSSAFQSYAQYIVTATAGTSTATFYLTQGFSDPLNQLAPPIQVRAINVPVGDTLTGQVGTTGAPPLSVGVYDEHGFQIPNVAMFLVNLQDPSVGPSIQCVAGPGAGAGTVLTDN